MTDHQKPIRGADCVGRPTPDIAPGAPSGEVVDSTANWREVRDRLNYFFKQIDGSYQFPNSMEGDLLKLVHKALEAEGR